MRKYIAIVGDHSTGTLFNGVLVTTEEQMPDERFEEYIQKRIGETEDEEFTREYYSFFEIESAIGEKIVNAVGEDSELPSPASITGTDGEDYCGGYGEGTLAIVKLFKVE